MSLTSHEVHGSHFALSFEEWLHRCYHTSDDNADWKLERVNASIVRLILEADRNWRSTLSRRYAENLAHYGLECDQVHTDTNPRIFYTKPVN